MKLSEIVERVKKEAEQRGKLFSDESLTSENKIELLAEKPISEYEQKESYSIHELLAIPQSIFINEIYSKILGRIPDESAREYETELKNKKLSKLEIIADIRFSDEGKRNSVKIRGLYKRYLFNKIKKIPVLGYLFDYIITALKLPLLKKDMQQIGSDLEDTAYSLSRFFYKLNILENEMLKKVDVIEEELKAHVAEIELKANRSEIEGKADKSELQLKADRSELNDKVDRTEMNTKMETKVEKEDFDRLNLLNRAEISELEDRVYEKADKSEVEAYKEAFKYARLYLENIKEEITNKIIDLKPELIGEKPVEKNDAQIYRVITDIESRFYDKMYLDFESIFRGTEEDVYDKLTVYTPLFQKLKHTDGLSLKAVDLGCGRGEMLEFTNSFGLEVVGVDVNKLAVSLCIDKNFNAVAADALDYLMGLSEGSVSLITTLHMVEHMDNDKLFNIIRNVYRVLESQGMFLIETPNPRNILVGSGEFYRDFSHIKPIFPDTLKFLLEYFGFVDVRVYFFDGKYGEINLVEADKNNFDSLQDYIDISRDYAVVGYKK